MTRPRPETSRAFRAALSVTVALALLAVWVAQVLAPVSAQEAVSFSASDAGTIGASSSRAARQSDMQSAVTPADALARARPSQALSPELMAEMEALARELEVINNLMDAGAAWGAHAAWDD